MKVEIHAVKRYILSEEDKRTLYRAAELFDELYSCCENDGEYESDFLQARDDIDYLINQLEEDGTETFWKEGSSLINEL